MFSSVVHFNQATRQLSTWVKATVSSIGAKDDWGAFRSGFGQSSSPAAAIPKSSAWEGFGSLEKKTHGVNWIRLCRGNPRPDQKKKEEKERKITQRCQVLQEQGGEKTDV